MRTSARRQTHRRAVSTVRRAWSRRFHPRHTSASRGSIASRFFIGRFGRISVGNRTRCRDPAGGSMHRVRKSEEHTSELQSLMRISYAVFCLKKKITKDICHKTHRDTHYVPVEPMSQLLSLRTSLDFHIHHTRN